nr:reverse transcriptase domain-containing protein [Tanacetum cinerariifolium]
MVPCVYCTTPHEFPGSHNPLGVSLLAFFLSPGRVLSFKYSIIKIEAKTMATITGSQVNKFLWDNIVCRCGLLGEIVSDNVKHPQSNGLIEREQTEAWLKESRLDLPEERRKCVVIREAKAKLKMTKYYNTRIRGVTFRPGDFVYRINEASHAMDGGKLGPKWEGPYEVTEALRDGAYRLRSVDGTVLSWTWNDMC